MRLILLLALGLGGNSGRQLCAQEHHFSPGIVYDAGFNGPVWVANSDILAFDAVTVYECLDRFLAQLGYICTNAVLTKQESISLDPTDLFRKVVLQRRGGYCFELNGLFALLLEDVGFAVTRLAARVLYGAEGERPRSHQLLMVKTGANAWIVDVGFGGHGLLEPLRLAIGEEGRQGQECFRLVVGERGEYLLQGERDRLWMDIYSFGLDSCLPVDYLFASYYHSHSPDSLFTQQSICTMPTPEGTGVTHRQCAEGARP